DNGAVRVLAGSHRRGPAARDAADPTRFLADPARLDTSTEHIVAVPAGALLVFPPLMGHRSSPHTSGPPRPGVAPSVPPPPPPTAARARVAPSARRRAAVTARACRPLHESLLALTHHAPGGHNRRGTGVQRLEWHVARPIR